MKTEPFFVSFYPRIPMEENLSVFEDLDDPGIQQLLVHAAGILLPPYTPPWRYREITRLARNWFPRLEARFDCFGKSKQIQLFRRIGVRHPRTHLFANPSRLMDDFTSGECCWEYPAVLKGDRGGGGSTVYPIYQPGDLPGCLDKLAQDEPVLLQTWVNHGGKDLRVVTYGDHTISYFRVGDGRFYNNVCRGGRIDYELCPAQRRKGSWAVLEFCRRAAIDVAGFDLMFPDDGDPVFIEINFHFGRKGLGGILGHHGHMLKAVRHWRSAILSSG